MRMEYKALAKVNSAFLAFMWEIQHHGASNTSK